MTVSLKASTPPFRSTLMNHVELLRSSKVFKADDIPSKSLVLQDCTEAPASQVVPAIVSTVWKTPAWHTWNGHNQLCACAPAAIRVGAVVVWKTGCDIRRSGGLPVP